jgi:hypothetical protein
MDNTDTALASAAIVSIAICCICGMVSIWRGKQRMKSSRSDNDLQSMIGPSSV